MLKSQATEEQENDLQVTIFIIYQHYVVKIDKGFVEIENIIYESNEYIHILMPPFLKNESELTKEGAEETSTILSVRVHVEIIMQWFRIYDVNKITENQFYHIDDIKRMCGVLVNLQPTFIAKIKNSHFICITLHYVIYFHI